MGVLTQMQLQSIGIRINVPLCNMQCSHGQQNGFKPYWRVAMRFLSHIKCTNCQKSRMGSQCQAKGCVICQSNNCFNQMLLQASLMTTPHDY